MHDFRATILFLVILIYVGGSSQIASSAQGAEEGAEADPAWLTSYLEANKLVQAEDISLALAKSEDAYRSYVAEYGEQGIDFAYIAYLAGTLHFRNEAYGKAMPPLEMAYKIIKSEQAEPPATKATLAIAAGSSAFRDHQYQKSADYLGEGLNYLSETGGELAQREITVRLDRARSLMPIDPELALSDLEKAGAQAAEILPKRNVLRSSVAIYTARALISLGRLDEASKLLNQAMRMAPDPRNADISGIERWIWQDRALVAALKGHRSKMVDSYARAGVAVLNPRHMSQSSWDVSGCVIEQDGSTRDDWAVLEIDVGDTGQLARAELVAFGPPGDTRFVSRLLREVRTWEFSDGLAAEPVEKRSLLRLLIRCDPLSSSPRESFRKSWSRSWQRSYFDLATELVPLKIDAAAPGLSDAVEKVMAAAEEYEFGQHDKPAHLEMALSAALQIAVQNYGEQSPLLINYYRNLGRLALDQRNINEAERHISAAIRLARAQEAGQSSDAVTGAFWDYASCAALLDHRDNLITASDQLIDTLERFGRPPAEIIDAKLKFASHFMFLTNHAASKKVEGALTDVLMLTDQDTDRFYTERLRAASILANTTTSTESTDVVLQRFATVESMALERFPEDNIFVSDARRGQAFVLARSGQIDKARIIFDSMAGSSDDSRNALWNPVIISKPKPRYPRDLLERHLSGFAFAQSEVDETGNVSTSRILLSSPPFLFERPTKKAMKTARYLPLSAKELRKLYPAVMVMTYRIDD